MKKQIDVLMNEVFLDRCIFLLDRVEPGNRHNNVDNRESIQPNGSAI